MLVPRTRYAPLPLVGRGWGWGVHQRTTARHPPRRCAPTLPTRGRVKTEFAPAGRYQRRLLAAEGARVHHDALLPSRENLGQPNSDNPIQKHKRGEDVMPNEPDDGARRTVSRRHLFKQAAGAAVALSATTPALVT